METVITKFFQEKSWECEKKVDDEGSSYYVIGMNHDKNNYTIVFEYDFDEKYFAVTAVTAKTLPMKYSGKVINTYNTIAQGNIPVIHILTQNGMVASKYNYELLDEEILTEKRIEHMYITALGDAEQIYPYLKGVIKKSKKNSVSKNK